MGLTILLIWDYDTPTGFAVSRHSRGADPLSEYRCTDQILDLLAQAGIVSTFACVGVAAEPGPLPLHNPDQIRRIHALGHEIASHSHRHELIPALSRSELLETLRISRETLEACIGAPVVGFVPPWNRPFHHPRRLSFSFKDWRDGSYRWRHSVVSLCRDLAACGYRWVRIGHSSPWQKLRLRLRPGAPRPPLHRPIDRYHGVTAFPNSYCGYDARLTDWIAQLPPSAAAHPLVIYAHPHGIEHPNSQHWRHLTAFVEWVAAQRGRLGLTFTTPSAYLAAHA